MITITNIYTGEISFQGAGVSLSAENLQFNNFQIFDVFSLCFTKCRVTKYKQNQTKRKTEKQAQQENEKPSLCGCRVLRLILWGR